MLNETGIAFNDLREVLNKDSRRQILNVLESSSIEVTMLSSDDTQVAGGSPADTGAANNNDNFDVPKPTTSEGS